MVRVKVCGITNLKDAEAACRLGADALGFVFAKSPRRIDAEKARSISLKTPPYVSLVGVFVDEDIKKLLKIAEKCRIDCVQLHGNESINYCKQLKKYYKIVKAVRIGEKKDLDGLSGYDVDAFLLDTYRPGKAGGTGEKFDWNLALRVKKLGRPVILSGGLKPRNVRGAIRKVKPYAVDVSSGVESSPGRKSMKLMKEFIQRAKKTS
ncbi:MAG TPA: phosphoribosylanthranilate isomerase [Candidatus Omnitrophota bacterium]|nr:phosphoribosylanthranilate isomerase [Candidatus Omnitrophota bacterium]HRZ66728.1 phosphoribosylanthranilate isomerase [Candidatus Omnitrophota bacterium]